MNEMEVAYNEIIKSEEDVDEAKGVLLRYFYLKKGEIRVIIEVCKEAKK